MKKLWVTLLGCGALLAGEPARADVKLVMFRHAEKPAAGLGQLTARA